MTARTRLFYTSSGIHACKNELVLKLHIIYQIHRHMSINIKVKREGNVPLIEKLKKSNIYGTHALI